MSDLGKHDASEFAQFGALTVEQQAFVNAFVEMVRKGQIQVASGGPSVNQSDLQQEDGVRLDSTQVEHVDRGLGDDIQTESLNVGL